MTKFDPRRVQQALVCMHFDPKYAAKIRSPKPQPELSPRERALLREVDHRALATDGMRRARALQVILDEYPVSAALIGVDAVDRYLSSAAFRACVYGRGSMVLGFGEAYLGERTRGVGALETAMARARRADLRGAEPLPPGALVRAPGVEALRAPAGTLAWYERARARLEPEPLQALAKLRKPWSQSPPRRGLEQLLIEARPDGSLALGTASEGLVALLIAASSPTPRASLAALALELGAEPEETGALLDGLVADGLLASG